MNAELARIVYQNLSNVFEKMFFTVLRRFPDHDRVVAPAENYLEVAISYQGGRKGTIRFYFPEQLARRLTRNFLAIEDELLSDSQIYDMVKEASNMAVGSLLGDLDPEGSCRLGIPACRRCDNFSPVALAGEPGVCAFDSEQGMLWFVIEEICAGNS
jgi:CheY-specific phosphatase CheX